MNIWEWVKLEEVALSDSDKLGSKRIWCGPIGRVVYASLDCCTEMAAPDGWVIEEVTVEGPIRPGPRDLGSPMEIVLKLRRKPVTIHLEFRSRP